MGDEHVASRAKTRVGGNAFLAVTVADRSGRELEELERGDLLGGPAQRPCILEQEERMALGIEEQHAVAVASDALDLLFRPDDPAGETAGDLFEPAANAVLVLESMHHHVELEETHGTDDRRGSAHLGSGCEENLRGAFLGELPEPCVELLASQGVLEHHAREVLGSKARDAAELEGAV